MRIDVNFDFTTDTPGFWDHYWINNDGMGAGSADPDLVSNTLRAYHQFLWSKELPNGQKMDLITSDGSDYLYWNGFRFGSDSITASFRYKKYRSMIAQVQSMLENYKEFYENYVRRSYTIGGMIIFPKHRNSINQQRGCNPYIVDRFDLTLECIRRYYLREQSPLTDALNNDASFFRLFVDFRGYVDFFFLQDCVSNDYSSVVFWEGDGTFRYNPFPKTVEDYIKWITLQLDFVENRNKRISDVLNNKSNAKR